MTIDSRDDLGKNGQLSSCFCLWCRLNKLLLLIPTDLELQVLGKFLPAKFLKSFQLCGFGPIVAAGRTARLLAEQAPAHVLLIGIAGQYDSKRMPIGSAHFFDEFQVHGVGVGEGANFLDPRQMQLPQWKNGDSSSVFDTLPFIMSERPKAPNRILTVCAASADAKDAAIRRERYPLAVAEDMESFSVAFACQQVGVPLTVIRGVSNVAGNRNHGEWRIDDALRSSAAKLLDWLEESDLELEA